MTPEGADDGSEDAPRRADGDGEAVRGRRSLEDDDVFALLSHTLRREALTKCRTDAADGLDQTELVDWLLAQRDERPSRRARRRMEIELHHVHLPKLEEHGVVEYDADAGIVTYLGHSLVERLLTESVADVDR